MHRAEGHFDATDFYCIAREIIRRVSGSQSQINDLAFKRSA